MIASSCRAIAPVAGVSGRNRCAGSIPARASILSARSAAPAPEQGGRGGSKVSPASRAGAVAPQHLVYALRGGMASMRGSRRLLLGVAQSEELLTSKRRVAGSSPAAETINARSSTEERARPKGKAAGSIPAERTIFDPLAAVLRGHEGTTSRRERRGGGRVIFLNTDAAAPATVEHAPWRWLDEGQPLRPTSHTRALRPRFSPSSPFPDPRRASLGQWAGRAHLSLRRSA